MELGITEIIAAIALSVIGSIPAWLAVYFVRRQEPMVDARLRELERERERDRREILRLQALVAELNVGIKILQRQIESLGATPDYQLGYNQVSGEIDTAKLQQAMARTFDLDELNDLAFQLNIETGELGGDTVSSRSRAIVKYMERRGELVRLLQSCRKLRPKESFQ